MLKLITTLIVLAVPATALAHPGHPHAGSELTHHLLDYAGLAAAAALVYAGVKLVSRKGS